jgi:acetyl esterase/lipase
MDDPTHKNAVAEVIAGIGYHLGPEVLKTCSRLFRDEQLALAAPGDRIADLAYGPALRQQLDLYRPIASVRPSAAAAPILLWVHGGGFVRGEKHSPAEPFNAHMGRFAARHGLLGAVMNYRLAPDSRHPAGGEDVGLALDWLRGAAAQYGGDPQRIVAVGTSAGAVHVATHLMLRAGREGLAGAALFSGLYGVTPLDPPDLKYYGTSPGEHPGRALLEAVAATPVPLFVACAQFDPPRFQAETLAVLQRRLELQGHLPRAWFATGHNHYSLAMHIGGRDARLGNELLGFIAGECHARPQL